MAAAYTAEHAAEREGKAAPEATEPPAEEEKPVATAGQIDAYRKQIEAKIKGNFKPPSETKKERVIVLIGLAETGKVTKMEIKEPSGTDSFDEAILKAISSGEPYPPAPHTKKDTLDFRITADGTKVSAERE
jgi:TonB family protein